jgi:hypothetical protein
MKRTHLRATLIVFAVLALIAASLACRDDERPEPPPTPYIPPTATPGSGPPPTATSVPLPTESGPNLVITGVTLSTNTPPKDGWVVVDVTIQNQGGAAADGFELVLIPHYGWGPPNPAGYELLPSIAPGATHSVTFTPGVLYTDVGTFTLRVLVTDDWYAAGNPDSTGSAGDLWDETITVGGGVPVTEGPNLVITSATLSSSTPGVDEWVTVDVTIANEGMAVATGYQLVVIPHYGVGPPNPGGFEDLPALAPGDTYATTITPGLLYSSPGAYTVRVLVTDDWYDLGNPDSTGLGGDYQDLPVTVTGPTESGPNLEITAVVLSTNAPPEDGWVVVDVTIRNQGGAAADGFELVLIPHYGWGPPNPAGYELLPSIAPGAARGVTFSPGVLYPDVGTFTLRVLVTDDWGATGNPDSTGSAGDIWDETIVVGGG